MPKGIGYGKKKRRKKPPHSRLVRTKMGKEHRSTHKGRKRTPKRQSPLKGKLRKRLYVRTEDRTFVPEGFYAKKPPKHVRRFTRRRGLSGSPTVYEQVPRKKRGKRSR